MRPFRQVRILRKYWDTIAAEVSCNVTDDGDQMMALSTKSAASDSEKNPRRGPPGSEMTAKTASCTARKASLASANVREVADREEDQLPRSPDTLQTVFFATSLLDVHCNGCSHRAILREDELAKLQSPAPVAQAPVREVRPATFRSIIHAQYSAR